MKNPPVFVVWDTNVLVSSQLKQGSLPSLIVEASQTGLLVPVINNEIILEYCDVLFRPKFGFGQQAATLLRRLFDASVDIAPASLLSGWHMPDADDAVFYATALAARKAGLKAYVVTGNQRHFPQEDFIVSPRAMLDIIGQDVPA